MSNNPGYLQCLKACEQIKNDRALWLGFAKFLLTLDEPGDVIARRVEVMEQVWEEQRKGAA